MEIQLLEAATEDLREGYRFYEAQSDGLGDYFLDCVQSDVRSLLIYAGIHAKAGGFHRMLVNVFHLRSTTSLMKPESISMQSWIVDAIPLG